MRAFLRDAAALVLSPHPDDAALDCGSVRAGAAPRAARFAAPEEAFLEEAVAVLGKVA